MPSQRERFGGERWGREVVGVCDYRLVVRGGEISWWYVEGGVRLQAKPEQGRSSRA